ncbi:alpha-ketoglutarate-dependent dioxygenase alkB homolog 7, mitochondrial isoform X1 [Manis javanica]|uniref:alpha-ketoglutarate-dependent dioxygenase alkB homolog 7, mitochondrial isoform X1 n=1 Tax=Manis javanica TaxID=9974 RepID=UPI003C6CF567
MAGSGLQVLRALPGPGWVRGSGPVVLSRLRDAAMVRPGFLSAAEEETLSRELEPELRRRRYEPSMASERQRSHAGPRQARPSCSACRRRPLALTRPCCPRCMYWTWNLRATSSHTWTASSSAEPPSLACPCCLPVSCGWCTRRSPPCGWSFCWSQAPSTSSGTAWPGSSTPQGSARYDFSHEILRDEQSFFGERRVPRGRRISVICRSLPEGVRPGEPRQLPRTC